MSRDTRWGWIRCLLVMVAVSLMGRSQEGAVPDAAEDTEPPPFREQRIYIPYEKLWQTFGKDGRGVFLPYEQFLDLWRRAAANDSVPTPKGAPVDVVLTDVSAVMTVGEDVASITAEVGIELLKEGWHRVPLRLNGAAVTAARIGDDPARLIYSPDNGYQLLIENPDGTPLRTRLALEFAKSFERSPGRNAVAFAVPESPVCRWEVRVPDPGVKIDIEPMVAASEVPTTGDPTAFGSRVLAFVGGSKTVRVAWTPRAEGAKGLKALMSVNARHECSIEEGVVRSRVKLDYTISRAELQTLALRAPADEKVVNVFDPNVREWSVRNVDGTQIIDVQLFEPAKGRQALTVNLERFADASSVTVPMVEAEGAVRQRGMVLVRTSAGLRADADGPSGLTQVALEELTEADRKGGWAFSYRYAALPFALPLSVEKIQPRVVVGVSSQVALEPESLQLTSRFRMDVERTGVFQFDLEVPDGFDLRAIQGMTLGDAAAADIDAHHLGDPVDGVRPLRITLRSQAMGPTGLLLILHRNLQEPGLVTPTDTDTVLALRLPRATGDRIKRETGSVAIFSPGSLRVTPTAVDALRPVDVQRVQQQNMPGDTRILAAYEYTNQAVAFELRARRRPPHITARQFLRTRVDAGVVAFESTFFFDVLYSGVKELRLDVPANEAQRMHISPAGIQRTPLEGAEVDDGWVAWRLWGEREFLGTVRFSIKWERPIEDLDVGGSAEIPIPVLKVRDVDRAWGQIVLEKSESMDIAPTGDVDGLRPIDARHDLMPGAAGGKAARAFEFHGDWALTVQATRYQPQDVKATSVERGLVRFVVTRGGVTSVQAVYRMRSVRQRITIALPVDVQFDTQPVRLNGRAVTLEKGDEGRYHVPLVGVSQDAPFLLELRYLVPDDTLDLQPPAFPLEPAIQQVYASVYIPRSWSYLGARGTWQDELVWYGRGFGWRPRGRRPDNDLMTWVAGGLPVDQDALMNLATDGERLLFSTLRPPADRRGAIRVVCVRRWLPKTLVVILILGIGVACFRSSLERRALAVGALVTVMTLLAVFFTALTYALVSGAAVGAAVVVGIAWFLWFLLVMRPNDPLVVARREARHEAREARKARAAADRAPPALPPEAQNPPQDPPEPSPDGPEAGEKPAPKPESAPGEATEASDEEDSDHDC